MTLRQQYARRPPAPSPAAGTSPAKPPPPAHPGPAGISPQPSQPSAGRAHRRADPRRVATHSRPLLRSRLLGPTAGSRHSGRHPAPPVTVTGGLPAACAAGSASSGLFPQVAGTGAGSCECPVGVLQAAPCGQPCPPLVTVGPAATPTPPRNLDTQPGPATKETTMPPAQYKPTSKGHPRPPGTNSAGMTGPAPRSADLIHRRHLEKTITWT